MLSERIGKLMIMRIPRRCSTKRKIIFGARYRGRRHFYAKTSRKDACVHNTRWGRNSEADFFSEKSSELTYLNKDTYTDTSAYNRVLNAPKKLDASYNPTMQNIHDPAIEGNYKVTRDTSVTTIIDHEDEKIQWACSTSIYTDDGEPETLKEAMTRPNGHL